MSNTDETQSASAEKIKKNQLAVLRALSASGWGTNGPKPFQLTEIAELSGLKDEKEVQRSLYVLEGHKLVSPTPAGDFTSKIWHITEDGAKLAKRIEKTEFGLL